MERIELPCRECSDEAGREVKKHLRAFVNPGVRQPDEVWRTCLALGQTMSCFQCRRKKYVVNKRPGKSAQPDRHDPGLYAIYCATCDTPRSFEFFSEEDRAAWHSPKYVNHVFECLPCRNKKPDTKIQCR